MAIRESGGWAFNGRTYPVFDVQIAVLTSILKECSFFEYYLVDPEFRWIIADTDHNEILVLPR